VLRQPAEVIDYALGPEVADDDVVRALAKLGQVGLGPPDSVSRTYLETFDGRVFRRGCELQFVHAGADLSLMLTDADGVADLRCSTDSPVRFAWDLEEGPLRDRLEEIVEMRMLKPLVFVRGSTRPVEVRNRDGKLVIRGALEDHEAALPEDDTWIPLARILHLQAVRGYGKELERVAGRVEAKLGAEVWSVSLLQSALNAVGSSVPEYSNKVRVDLSPDQPSEEAVRQVLRYLLDAMLVNEGGTIEGLDSEFLHDFRVAVRRTRSALTQIKGVFPHEVVEHVKTEFGWLGSVTGPARDMDVYLLCFPSFLEMLPAPLRPDLEPLHDLLRRRQRKEQRRVARALRSSRYARLVESWSRFLAEGDTSDGPRPKDAERPIIAVASKRIQRVFDLTLEEGTAIGPGSPPEALHELRKTCKKLRYLLEFFRSLYPGGAIDDLTKSLKNLQDNLGEFQDLSVQIHSLEGFEEQLRHEGRASETTFRAIEVLVDSFRERQAEVRVEFTDRFRSFSDPETRDLLQGTLCSSYPSRKGRTS
jgi:CHAD domain-containing protein